MTEELLANAYIKGASDLLQGKIEGMPKIVVIPEGATNGEVIKTLFPDASYHDSFEGFINSTQMSVRKDWWNAPYKTESEGKI